MSKYIEHLNIQLNERVVTLFFESNIGAEGDAAGPGDLAGRLAEPDGGHLAGRAYISLSITYAYTYIYIYIYIYITCIG